MQQMLAFSLNSYLKSKMSLKTMLSAKRSFLSCRQNGFTYRIQKLKMNVKKTRLFSLGGQDVQQKRKRTQARNKSIKIHIALENERKRQRDKQFLLKILGKNGGLQ